MNIKEVTGVRDFSIRFVKITILCCRLSGIFSIIGIVFLILFYGFYFSTGEGFGFGELNDAAVVFQYFLMIPVAIYLYNILYKENSNLSRVSLIIGLAGITGVIILQSMLVLNFISFQVQIGLVTPAFLLVLLWFIINGYIGKNNSILPDKMIFHIMAGLYFAYPFWVYSLQRKMLISLKNK